MLVLSESGILLFADKEAQSMLMRGAGLEICEVSLNITILCFLSFHTFELSELSEV